MFDTCPYCDSFDVRTTGSTGTEGGGGFCRSCGETWKDADETNTSLWESDIESISDDSV